LTYAELNRRANRLAHYLRELGVRPDKRIGICVERSLEMLVGLLAVMKASGAYVPLDPWFPAERLKYMVEDSRPVALLTQSRLQTLAEEIRQTTPVVDLSRSELWQGQPENNPGRGAVGMTPQHIAYVLYTSGSTGLPKGVAVQHSALVNFLRSMKEKPGIEAEDALLSVTT